MERQAVSQFLQPTNWAILMIEIESNRQTKKIMMIVLGK